MMFLSEVKPANLVTEKKGGKKGKKEEEQIAKYRELLQNIQDKERKEKDKDMEMEITWVPGMSLQHVYIGPRHGRMDLVLVFDFFLPFFFKIFFTGLKESTEKLVKKKMEGKKQMTPWEEFLEKKKDKKKEKRKGKVREAFLSIQLFLLAPPPYHWSYPPGPTHSSPSIGISVDIYLVLHR